MADLYDTKEPYLLGGLITGMILRLTSEQWAEAIAKGDLTPGNKAILEEVLKHRLRLAKLAGET